MLCIMIESCVTDIPVVTIVVWSLTHLVMSASVITQPRALHSPGVLLPLACCSVCSQWQFCAATSNVMVTMTMKLVNWVMFAHGSATWGEDSVKLDGKKCKTIFTFCKVHICLFIYLCAFHFFLIRAMYNIYHIRKT